MGQQQLLLIVLGVIVVGISIAVGVTQFKGSAIDSNRQAVIGDLVNLGAKAQRYYRTPSTLAGGNQDFDAFSLYSTDVSNSNGAYGVVEDATHDAANASGTGALTAVTGTAQKQSIIIVGWGTETGTDGTNPVKVYATVDANQIVTTVVN